jgi:hypothetical protein
MNKFFFLSFILFAQLTFAQDNIRFESSTLTGSTKKKNSRMNIVDMNPLAFISGFTTVEYERQLLSFLGLRGEVGLTFQSVLRYNESTSYALAFGKETLSGDAVDNNDYADDYNDFSIRNQLVGTRFSISPRLYFENDGLEGFFFSPTFRFISDKLEVQRAVLDYSGYNSIVRLKNSYQNESISNFDIMATFGHQAQYERLTLSWTLGLGVRMVNQTRQDLRMETVNQVEYLVNGERSASAAIPKFDFNIKVGFVF